MSHITAITEYVVQVSASMPLRQGVLFEEPLVAVIEARVMGTGLEQIVLLTRVTDLFALFKRQLP
jgi:hypothetical protein